jgi:thiol-disulfide isomerase/thioredoxin
MTPLAPSASARLQLPRWITALFVSVIALASAAALVVPLLRATPVPAGSTNVGVITAVSAVPGSAGRTGAVAPDFVWVQPSGETMRLSALRGRPVVLNFWATWCAPCKAELPRLEQAARDHPEIAFYAVDLDEDSARVRGFFDSLGITQLVPLIDVGSAVARAYGLGEGVPTTYFIGADGIVRAAVVGEMDGARIAAGLAAAAK